MRRAVAAVLAGILAALGPWGLDLSSVGSARVFAADDSPVVTVEVSGVDLLVTWSSVAQATRYQARHRAETATQWTWNTASPERSWTIAGGNDGAPRTIEVRAFVQNVWRAWTTVQWVPDGFDLDFDFVDYVDRTGLEIDSLDGLGHTFGKPCVADINGDDLLDVIWSNHYDAPWDVFLGTPGGTFTEDVRTDWSEGLEENKDNHACAAADFDGDGLVDLYESVGACEGTCAGANPLWIQNDDGTFTNRVMDLVSPAVTYNRSRAPVAFDGDGDGDIDLFVAAEGGGEVFPSVNRYLRNDGGVFVAQIVGAEENGNRVHCAIDADLDSDGDQDLVVCRENALDVYANDGTGQFTRNAFGMSPLPVARAVEFADIDRDGVRDLVVITDSQVQVRLGRSGDYSAIDYSFTVTGGRDVVTPDVDGDGWLDLYVMLDASNIDPSSPRADVVLRNLGASLPAFKRLDVPQAIAGKGDSAAVLPDFWGSGKDAVLVSNGWYNNRGDRQVIAIAGLEPPQFVAEPSTLIVATDPPRGSITVDGSVVASGTAIESSVGQPHVIRVPSTLEIGPFVWTLARWTDGGSSRHTIRTGPGPYELTATYTCPFEPDHVWCIEASGDNFSPAIAPLDDRIDPVGTTVEIVIDATDPDGHPLTFTADGLPNGITIDPTTGTLTGTLTTGTATTSPHHITITADDDHTGTATTTFTWTIDAPFVNQPPTINPIADRNDTEGDTIALTIDATDPDGHPLTFTADGLPNGITIDPTTGTLTGTLTTGTATTSPHHITITADDNHTGTATTTFTWNVRVPRVLFVAATVTSLPDRPLVDHLRARGFEVTVIDDDRLVSTAEAETYDLVWISSTVVPTKIGKRYALLATPVGTHEALLYKDMALATKFGQQSGQTQLLDALTGQTIVMTSKPELYSWGVPAPSATIVATLKSPTSRAAIFHYDVGDVLTDGSLAPSCRGAFFSTHLTPARFTAAAFQSFADLTDTLLAC